MERRKCLIKSLKNELWNFMADTHAYYTHFIIDRSINVSLWTRCLLGTWWTRRFVDRHVIRFWPIGKQKNNCQFNTICCTTVLSETYPSHLSITHPTSPRLLVSVESVVLVLLREREIAKNTFISINRIQLAFLTPPFLGDISTEVCEISPHNSEFLQFFWRIMVNLLCKWLVYFEKLLFTLF